MIGANHKMIHGINCGLRSLLTPGRLASKFWLMLIAFCQQLLAVNNFFNRRDAEGAEKKYFLGTLLIYFSSAKYVEISCHRRHIIYPLRSLRLCGYFFCN